MALEDMTSIFQPQDTKSSNGLAEGKGLASVTNQGSELNIDESLSATTGLANGKGLEHLTEEGSDLNIDGGPLPVPGTGLANGTGLINLGKGSSTLDIDGAPNNISSGLAKAGENK
tara:strand:- start:1285 stop:1632 length:348 start_codon:yes stop_codon:yes gene_type:complete